MNTQKQTDVPTTPPSGIVDPRTNRQTPGIVNTGPALDQDGESEEMGVIEKPKDPTAKT